MPPETNSCAEHLSPRERRMEEIVLEFLREQDAGREPDRQRLLALHPDLADELRAFFADQVEVLTLIQPFAGLKPPAGVPAQVGDYALLEKLGEGGMGVVYKARQLSLNRDVALKMIRDAEFSTGEAIERFRREAQTVATFDHANIVRVYEVSKPGEPPYFSMPFIEGGSLAALPPALKGDPRAAARVVVQVARAVDYAHQHGILHRDLKPANVLLDRAGNPCVVDFGLAERVRVDGAEAPAGRGIAGTVPYMAPEQTYAESRLTTAVDVYGLGVILYELLTGRRPFGGDGRAALIEQVRHAPPVPPRNLRRQLPRDLERICLMCLHKEPERRYASAAALADDLERFLAGRPTAARPVAPPERFLMWGRRRPAVALLTAAVVLSVAIGLGGFVGQYWQTQSALEKSQRNLYVSQLSRIYSDINRGHLDHAQVLLEQSPERFRAWEFYCLRNWCAGDLTVLNGHAKDVNCVACSPDGKLIVSGGADGAVLLWSVGQLPGAPEPLEPATKDLNGVAAVAFSRDGRRLAAARERFGVRVWDVAGRKPLFTAAGAGNLVALSPDGALVAVAKSSTVQVWRVDDGRQVHRFTCANFINDLAFSLDGRVLVTGGYGGVQEVRFWDLHTGQAHTPLRNDVQFWVSLLAFHPDPARQELATTQGSILSVWDLRNAREFRLHRGDLGKLTALAYHDEGRYLATGSKEGVLTVWDTTDRRLVFGARRHDDLLPGAAFLPRDPTRRIVYARGRQVVVERWQTGGARPRELRHDAPPRGVAFDPAGALLSVAGDMLWRWEPRVGRRTPLARVPRLRPTCLALSPDGAVVAVGSEDATVHFLDARTGRRLHLLREQHAGPVRGLAFNAAGDRLASAAADTSFVVWDVARGEALLRRRAVQPLLSVAFDPAGDHLLVGGENGVLQRWSLPGGEPAGLGTPGPGKHDNGVVHLAYSRDGALLATASSDATVLLWDARSYVPLARLVGHAGTVAGVAFSPDGRRLASAGQDGTVKLWDTASFQEVLSLDGPNTAALAVTFDPAGHLLVSAHHDGAVRLWDGTP